MSSATFTFIEESELTSDFSDQGSLSSVSIPPDQSSSSSCLVGERGSFLNISSEKFLHVFDYSDNDGRELVEELLVKVIIVGTTSREVLKYIIRNNNFTPNDSIALGILSTLPVTVLLVEHSFSKLEIIKNYLRSTMAKWN